MAPEPRYETRYDSVQVLRSPDGPRLDRRVCLATIASVAGWGIGLARAFARADEPKALDPAETEQRNAVEARARQVGIGPLRIKSNQHYLGIGNAPDRFLATALEICEGLARDFLTHFQERMFDVKPPERRLTIVALANPDAFASYLGIEPGGPVRGIYDLDTNRLVICDNRDGGSGGPQAERANTVALFHEATHQLCFNTGLLHRKGDVPLGISEGLAMYGEVRRPNGRIKIGAVNVDRLPVLAQSGLQGQQLFPVTDLIRRDNLFEEPGTQQLAYAQAWLLVHYLIQNPRMRPAFRDYLKAIGPRTDAGHRLDDAQVHLGNLTALDRELARYGNRLLRR